MDIKRRYEYKVRAVINENEEGPFSPPLIYEAKRGFCGNGKIDKGKKKVIVQAEIKQKCLEWSFIHFSRNLHQ